jgi:F1F0 ATPase subunit 2
MHVSLPELIRAFLVGILLGGCYFAALFWTVCRLPTSRHAGLLALGSFAARAAMVIAGLFWLVRPHWLPLFASLAGFVLSRRAAVEFWGPRCAGPVPKRASHGSD